MTFDVLYGLVTYVPSMSFKEDIKTVHLNGRMAYHFETSHISQKLSYGSVKLQVVIKLERKVRRLAHGEDGVRTKVEALIKCIYFNDSFFLKNNLILKMPSQIFLLSFETSNLSSFLPDNLQLNCEP